MILSDGISSSVAQYSGSLSVKQSLVDLGVEFQRRNIYKNYILSTPMFILLQIKKNAVYCFTTGA